MSREELSEEEWRLKLTPEQFRVLRQKGTEVPGSGTYYRFSEEGVYHCRGCDSPLFTSDTKFDSGSGWPAFYDAIDGALIEEVDESHGMRRIEVKCAKCGGHLGHLFKGEPYDIPKRQRYCINSVCLNFKK